jgi:hypothetical protein
VISSYLVQESLMVEKTTKQPEPDVDYAALDPAALQFLARDRGLEIDDKTHGEIALMLADDDREK